MTPAQEAQARYAALGEALVARFKVALKKVRSGLTGCAYVQSREIEAPWPSTSRNRLYILAHEIGHVALDHKPSQLRYVKEFEAEQFAHGLLRQIGVAVPRKMTDRAKGYVRRKIKSALRQRAKWIDPDIADWAGLSLNQSVDPKHVHDYFASAKARVEGALR